MSLGVEGNGHGWRLGWLQGFEGFSDPFLDLFLGWRRPIIRLRVSVRSCLPLLGVDLDGCFSLGCLEPSLELLVRLPLLNPSSQICVDGVATFGFSDSEEEIGPGVVEKQPDCVISPTLLDQ
ncbi:hypothetical protein F2Q69_00054726 [Brassica cretica]|uniref:Uncharacterized protein n=1 Tax=Brassica cretica TaxID=69181 RepID=A0A8S9MZM5_BRACR|nr:hypothetical protein F2Q69_00054726 [Brassica cretica]